MKQLFILTVFSVFLTMKVNAQIDKGTLLLGGDLNFSSETTTQGNKSKTSTLLRIAPRLGYALNAHFLVGGFLSVDFRPATGGSNTTLQVGPFVRYYHPLSFNTYLFGEAAFGYGINKTSTTSGADIPATTILDISAGPGISYFVTQSFAVEALFKYANVNTSVSGNSSSQSGMRFSLGVQFFLNR